jgi:hypothetical protein
LYCALFLCFLDVIILTICFASRPPQQLEGEVRRIHPKGDLQLPLPREGGRDDLLLPPQQMKEK